MKDKIFNALFIIVIVFLILTNPWFDLVDLISVPGWRNLSDSEKLEKCISWEKEVAEDLGVCDLPVIVFKHTSDSDESDTCCGLYTSNDNTITFFVDNTDDLILAYETICHEMRHAYQYQEARFESEIGNEFAANFNNYIVYSEDEEGYRNQLVEVDAREYASSMLRANLFDLFF